MKDELRQRMSDCLDELNDIESRIGKMKPLDRGKRYFTNYAIIRSSGTVEFVYRSIVADHFSSQLKNNRLNKYLYETIVRGSRSAKFDMMSGLLGKFDPEWSKKFKAAVQSSDNGERLIRSVNSLVENRHNFAHGKESTATFTDIKQYYIHSMELIEIFDSIVCNE